MKQKDTVTISKFSNGLTLLIEEMEHVESAAYELLIPGGVVTDEEDVVGASLILPDLTGRGAGPYDSKALSDAFDDAGIRHGEGCGFDRFSYRGTVLKEKLETALSLVAEMVLRPTMPEKEIENIRSPLLQDINALDDNPSRRVMVELGKRYYPAPYARPSMGTEEGLKQTELTTLQKIWSKTFRPEGAILSVAGKVDKAAVIALAERLFGKWTGKGVTIPEFGKLPPHHSDHIHSDSAQLQIALSYPSAIFGTPDYYAAKVANGLLSGGMFGRLFIEVREKRGLCYSVYSRHSATKKFGTMTAYAGTTPERAHETLEVMVKELRSVVGTVTDEELSRAKANLKSGLVMGEESPGSRASSNAADYFLDGRVRPLTEIISEVDKVDSVAIDSHFNKFPAKSFMLLTLGSKKIEAP